ncbi:MAG: hypothetical protein KDA57_19515 [Planctomycetales bacterium]|nr:hypothetical protein [Planctomycetales bacterium]
MASFTDNQGRSWAVDVTALSIQAIREQVDPAFLLDTAGDDNTFLRLRRDPVLLCRVVFLLCAGQRQQQGVTEADFYMQVIGDAIDRATEALIETIEKFSPSHTRKIIKAYRAQEALERDAIGRALERLENPELRQQMLDKLERDIDARVQQLLEV